VNTSGYGFLATFDGRQRAIRCAMSIRDSVQALGIEVRAGLHTGECEVRGDDIGGIAVHIGARVSALAGSNDVLVSSTLRGGMRAAQRDEIHRRFRDDEYEMITATSAFGMGIDKPNIRAVVHASVPDSLDSYYQEVGRAGRDGRAALALLFYRPEDLSLARFFAAHHPDEELLHRVYSALSADRPKRLKDLRTELGVRGRRLTTAVNLLDQAGAVMSGRRGFVASGEPEATAVGRAVEVVVTRERVDRTRVEMLRGYAETRECRRQILLAYFGETLPEPCGNCDRCRDNQIGEASAHEQRPAIPVNTTVEHRQ
jgi:ATP-dependent DNA helicase RecQ